MLTQSNPMHPAQIRIGSIDVGQLDQLVALHRLIVETLPDRSFLYSRGRDFFERTILSDGAVLGAFSGGKLIAYAAIVAPGADVAIRPQALGVLDIDFSQIALSAGCGVHPDFRREGLTRRLLKERALQAAALGAQFITGVVFPDNYASLMALHGLGYAVIGIHHDADGENYLLLRPTMSDFPAPANRQRQIGVGDSAANLAVLREARLIGLPCGSRAKPAFAYVQPHEVLSGSE